MLKTGLSHGVAIMPNAPKERFSDPVTGAHFEYLDMCARLERMAKKRFLESYRTEKKALSKDFMVEKQVARIDLVEREDYKTEKLPVEKVVAEYQFPKEDKS